MYLVESTPQTNVYEGSYWQCKVIFSNRFGNKVEFTHGSSDGVFRVPESRIKNTIERLEAGENPDEVAKSFPIEF